MKSLRLVPVFFLLAFGGLSVAAYGQNCSGVGASFLGACEWGSGSAGSCDFSAIHDCGSGISNAFEWDFGDGSGTTNTQTPFHNYPNASSDGGYVVSFTVRCTNGCEATAYRGVCFTVGGYGCINVGQGWN